MSRNHRQATPETIRNTAAALVRERARKITTAEEAAQVETDILSLARERTITPKQADNALSILRQSQRTLASAKGLTEDDLEYIELSFINGSQEVTRAYSRKKASAGMWNALEFELGIGRKLTDDERSTVCDIAKRVMTERTLRPDRDE